MIKKSISHAFFASLAYWFLAAASVIFLPEQFSGLTGLLAYPFLMIFAWSSHAGDVMGYGVIFFTATWLLLSVIFYGIYLAIDRMKPTKSMAAEDNHQ